MSAGHQNQFNNMPCNQRIVQQKQESPPWASPIYLDRGYPINRSFNRSFNEGEKP